MRVLLDECVDPAFARHFRRHQVESVVSAGLTGIENGELLRTAEPDFDAFVTVDKGMTYQQNLAEFDLVFVLLRLGSNRADRLAPYVERIEAILDNAQPRSFHVVTAEDPSP